LREADSTGHLYWTTHDDLRHLQPGPGFGLQKSQETAAAPGELLASQHAADVANSICSQQAVNLEVEVDVPTA
jgi:hypothetical protein